MSAVAARAPAGATNRRHSSVRRHLTGMTGHSTRLRGDMFRCGSAIPEQETLMAYEVPPLPYDYAALEPTIDEQTMRLHHDKHHQAYVDKANGALEGTEWADKPIEEVIASLSQIPDDKRGAVRNNGGGHLNHTLFWESMSPNG